MVVTIRVVGGGDHHKTIVVNIMVTIVVTIRVPENIKVFVTSVFQMFGFFSSWITIVLSRSIPSLPVVIWEKFQS